MMFTENIFSSYISGEKYEQMLTEDTPAYMLLLAMIYVKKQLAYINVKSIILSILIQYKQALYFQV